MCCVFQTLHHFCSKNETIRFRNNFGNIYCFPFPASENEINTISNPIIPNDNRNGLCNIRFDDKLGRYVSKNCGNKIGRWKREAEMSVNHSEWQKLLQVMKGSRRNPLTPGRWDHMWLKNDSFKNFCPRYLTKKFSKTKKALIGPHMGTVISNILVFVSMQYTI